MKTKMLSRNFLMYLAICLQQDWRRNAALRLSKTILKTAAVFICFALWSSLDIRAGSLTDQQAIVRDGSHRRDHDGGDDQDKRGKHCGNDDRDDQDQHDRNRDRDDRSRDQDDCDCKDISSMFEIAAPGVGLESPATLLTAFALENTGKKTANDITIRAITLPGGTLMAPSLPARVATVPSQQSVKLDADFTGTFSPGSTSSITVSGTFISGHQRHCFRAKANIDIPAAAPGSNALKSTNVVSNRVVGGRFPHQPPNSDNDENASRWTVPTGAFVPGTPTATETSPLKAPLGDPPAIDFVINNSLKLDGTFLDSGPVEPSGGASGGGVVFVSGNLAAAFSIDGGNTFTELDPTKIFPNDVLGFCCDQIVQYVPSIDRFVWLLQGKCAPHNFCNGYRLAMASPAEILVSKGTAWTYWNLTPNIFNQPPDSFDYPDLSVGDNFLYMTWDVGGSNGGHLVARTSLAGLKAAGTIEIDYTDPKDSINAWGSHLSQNTGNEIFWAGHNSNHSMRIYSLMEGSSNYFWQDVGIATWANNSPLSSSTPDSQNWIDFLFNPTMQNPGGGFPGNAVLGSTRSNLDQVWFAWSAGTDNHFPQPHVEMVTLNIDNSNPPNLNVQQQVQIWNRDLTFAYPALATNFCTGEIGFSIEGGGGGSFENHFVGFWGDFLAYRTTESNVGDSRFGDYVTIRQQPPTVANPGNLFSAFGYGKNKVPPPGVGTEDDLHYVLFGRPASSCPRLQ